MASLRDIRKRIRSVKNTRQITKAMKMVAAARLRKGQEALLAARPYAEALDQMMRGLVPADESATTHPLFTTRPERRVHLVLFTSDKGLAGGFNANAIRLVSRFLQEEGRALESVKLSTVGRKGFEYFKRRNVTLGKDHAGLWSRVSYTTAASLAQEWVDEFLGGEVDAVYLVYNEFVTAISQQPTRLQLLPFPRPSGKAGAPAQSDTEFTYEPSREAVLQRLVPQALAVKVYRALLESVASEHGARMNAMENATSNATDLIEHLTLNYNRTRQAVITKELMEIVSGAEALK